MTRSAERPLEPMEHPWHTSGALATLTRPRTRSASASHAAAMLLDYLVRGSSNGQGWVSGSRRRIATAERLSEWDVRVGIAWLLEWGWIERRQAAEPASAHYRLTAAFAKAVEAAGEEVSRSLTPHLPTPSPHHELRARAAPISPEILSACTRRDLMERLFKLNERPKRRGRGYSEPVLRATAVALHCFIQAALRRNEPCLASLRGLARETGFTFRSANRARARLIGWGLLTEQDGECALDHARLAQLLSDEGVDLPLAPAVHRRQGRHHDD